MNTCAIHNWCSFKDLLENKKERDTQWISVSFLFSHIWLLFGLSLFSTNFLSLIIWTTMFSQLLLRSTKSVKKKKSCKKLLKHSFSETPKSIYVSRSHWSCETKHRRNDDITFARHFARRLRDVRATSTRRKCKKSKNRQKTKKYVFFKFLTRVKSNTCKKWDVGSTYNLL
jgi:hypothetical protein